MVFKAGTSYRDFYFYVPIMSSRCFEFSAKNYHIGLSFVQKIYHFVLHISQIFLWTKFNNHSLLWNYTSISALTECVLSLFMVSKWFLVQLWCFIGGWQISMQKERLSTQKTPSHLEYRVPKLLSSETDYQRNFQSVDTLPSLKKVRCSLQLLSLNLFLFWLMEQQMSRSQGTELGSVSTDWKFRW